MHRQLFGIFPCSTTSRLSSYLGIGGIRMESSHSLTPDPDASATSSQQMNRLSMQPLLAGGESILNKAGANKIKVAWE